MKPFDIDMLRQLFSEYSPFKTNKQLADHYYHITNSSLEDFNSIRTLYNKEILYGFLNETVIKSAFVKKFCFKKSPKSTVTVFEMNTGNSRADLCILNGSSMVFEIKTEYDTLKRLKNQIRDYQKTFEYVNVIIPPSKLERVIRSVDSTVGIILYQKKQRYLCFDSYREPMFNSNYDSSFQLEQLTKKQLKEILPHSTDERNDYKNIILSHYTKEEINRLYIDLMKKKYFDRWCYLFDHKQKIMPLDYQWFFKNNISIESIYGLD